VSHAPFLSVVPWRGGDFFKNEVQNYSKGNVSVPLRGVGCFLDDLCGLDHAAGFRPLAGCGLFPEKEDTEAMRIGFRPLAGCGLFRQICTFFLAQQEKELSTLLFYCIILADGLSIAN